MNNFINFMKIMFNDVTIKKELIKEIENYKIYKEKTRWISKNPIKVVESSEFYITKSFTILGFNFNKGVGFKDEYGIIETFDSLEEAEDYIKSIKEL